MVTEYTKAPGEAHQENAGLTEEFNGKELFTFFVSSEHGIKEQDDYKLESDVEGLLGISVPNFEYIVPTNSDDINKAYQVFFRLLSTDLFLL